MNRFASIIRNLLIIAERVKNEEITFNDIPFESIMEIIRQIYAEKIENGEIFSEMYGIMFVKSLEHKDAEEIATVLNVLARHIELIVSDENEIQQLTLKNHLYQSKVAYLLNCEKVRKWHEVNDFPQKVPFEGRGVIYTAITGNYDDVKEPKYINPNYDYILFTNNPQIKSNLWQVRLIDNEGQLDNVRLARKIKILGHKYLTEYDYSVWVDSKFEIIDNLEEYIHAYRKTEPILCFPHYENDCAYKEKELCELFKKDDSGIMEKQMERYRNEGYPVGNGLVETGILVRDLKNARLIRVMETWWQEILNGSKRDQLSFNYSCWKNDFVYDLTDLYIYGNKYVNVYSHN